MSRAAWITGRESLRERLAKPEQVDASAPEAELPQYLESFLAHLRLLVGVPFEYLVPDERLLPLESIRFFYLDRSWTDRLVDGAIAVGKIGTREQTHHVARDPAVKGQLDLTERAVRVLQRGLATLEDAKAQAPSDPAGVVTGFLLRSAAVCSWPHMDVRAFDAVVPENWQPGDANTPDEATKHQLRTLRLERLSPSILVALFDGVPKLVWCEEPHHGVPFGVVPKGTGFVVPRRRATGEPEGTPIAVPVRKSRPRVIAVSQLRAALEAARQAEIRARRSSTMPDQTGSAAFAIELLAPPWRQRFQDKSAATIEDARIPIATRIGDNPTQAALKELLS
jgi:hypothetical protein